MAIPIDVHGRKTVSPARVNPHRTPAATPDDFAAAVTTARNGRATSVGAGGRGQDLTFGGSNVRNAGFTDVGARGSSAQGYAPHNSLPDWFPFIPLLNQSYPAEPPTPRPTRQDLENDPDGRLEYPAQEQDTLATIADRFGRTEEEIIAANPTLVSPSAEPASIEPGQAIVIYNDARAPAIAELVNTADPERRGDLIHQQLLASVHGNGGNTPTPGDHLATAEAELIALKPNDEAFRQQVSDQGDELTYNWQSMGLTHDVWDPLLESADNDDWAAFDEVLTGQLRTLAMTSPTVEEIEAFGEVLKTYAPNEDFSSAVDQTIEDFLVNDPAAAAEEIAPDDVYDPWQMETAARLRELTDPLTVDPLTAALIARQAQPTIELLLEDSNSVLVPNPLQVYQDLSAVADSAARSPEGEDVIDSMLDVILPDGQDSLDYQNYHWIAGSSGDAGTPPLLSLAVADRLLQRGNTEQAADIAQLVAVGVRGQEEQLIGSVNSLSETLLPLFTPMQWDTFLSAPNDEFELPDLQALGEQWLSDNPEIAEDVDESLGQINEQVYWLNRSRDQLEEYAPRLEDLEGHDDLVDLARLDPAYEEALQIVFASNLSPASAIEDLRDANLAGMDDGTLTSLSQIILDPNWHFRMYPRTVDAVWAATGRSQPFAGTLGLELYNAPLYSAGVVNQSRELMAKIEAHGFFDAIFDQGGWRNIVSGFHYGWGAAIEGTALANRVTGRTLSSSSAWGRLLDNTLLGRSFALYNVVGTATYALEGDERAAAALGIATIGSVGRSFIIPRLATAPAWAVPGANLLLLVGTGLLVANDIYNQEQLAAASEPFNEAYLIAAGVDPDIARHLSNNSAALFNGVMSDNPGASPAGPLAALAEYQEISQSELLRWLNEQDAAFVGAFVNQIHRVHPNEEGEYPVTYEPEGLGWDWGRILEFSSPLTVDDVPAELLIGDPGAIKTRQGLEDVANWAEGFGQPLPHG